ncbi:hypothetical protein [Gluconacetobacter takamatsuzukensis]|uniref:Uncharacterized protein n=1 Tax=Gluconacetobacter takamatsuzukensis TaxID=1286190 RepID=A0A7W4KBD7_9PROT|nr:hypothetical protein [Gluconacetobacter takamatsuzukensis]MBB2203824.1 hypothetical protein [Gluconacetobacter takamatsuzukensis]
MMTQFIDGPAPFPSGKMHRLRQEKSIPANGLPAHRHKRDQYEQSLEIFSIRPGIAEKPSTADR